MSSGFSGMLEAVELAGLDGAHGRGALHELVAREREEDALRHRAERVAGAADALQQRRERARRAEVADEIDVADVDAELERGGRDDHRHRARLEPLLGGEAQLARHAAVVRGDALGAEPLAERVRDALDQPARVDEDDRRAVRAHQRGEAIVDLGAQLVAGDRRRAPGRASRRAGRARGGGRRRRWRSAACRRPRSGRRRPAAAPPRRSASASPTGRCAAAGRRRARRAARATAPGARRACRRRRRGSRRRSPSTRRAAAARLRAAVSRM